MPTRLQEYGAIFTVIGPPNISTVVTFRAADDDAGLGENTRYAALCRVDFDYCDVEPFHLSRSPGKNSTLRRRTIGSLRKPPLRKPFRPGGKDGRYE